MCVCIGEVDVGIVVIDKLGLMLMTIGKCMVVKLDWKGGHTD